MSDTGLSDDAISQILHILEIIKDEVELYGLDDAIISSYEDEERHDCITVSDRIEEIEDILNGEV